MPRPFVRSRFLLIVLGAAGVALSVIIWLSPRPPTPQSGRELPPLELTLPSGQTVDLLVTEYSNSGGDLHYCYHTSFMYRHFTSRGRYTDETASALASALFLALVPEAEAADKQFLGVSIFEASPLPPFKRFTGWLLHHDNPDLELHTAWEYIWRRSRVTGDWRPFSSIPRRRDLPSLSPEEVQALRAARQLSPEA